MIRPVTKRPFLIALIPGLVIAVTSGCGRGGLKEADGIRREAERIRKYVFQHRPLPLKDLPVEIELSVTDFGAIPDDGMDDLPGMEAAIRHACGLNKPVQIKMPQGRYELAPDNTQPDHCLRIEHMENLVISGNGSEIIIRNPLMGFLEIVHSRNIIVKDLFIDYDPLPFTQGYVTAVHPGEGSFELEVAEGFPELDMTNFVNTRPNMNWRDCPSWGMLRDPDIPTRLKAGCPNVFFARTIEKSKPHRYRISVEPAAHIRYFEVGDKYVHLARYEQIEANFIHTDRCEQITFMNIENYTSISWNYTNSYTSLFSAINCRVVIKDGRWHTLDSDGIGTMGGRTGPWIENCVFESIADDCFVLGAGYLYIKEKAGERKLIMYDLDPYKIRKKDRILFYNPRQGIPIAEVKVTDVDYAGQCVTFDKTLPDMQAGNGKPHDFGINKNTGNPFFVIRDNVVRDSRRNAVRMRNGLSYGIFEHNLFEGNEDPPMTIWSDVNWNLPKDIRDQIIRAYRETDPSTIPRENADIEYLLITGNTFRECSYNNPHGNVFLTMNRTGNQPAGWQAIQNIYLLDNQFTDWSGHQAIRIQCARNVCILGNKFVNEHNPYREDQPGSVISLFNCSDIYVYDNQVLDDRNIREFILPEEVSNLQHDQINQE
jgi:hypothetical protein